MLVQLNKCVVMCGSDLRRWHGGDGCLSLTILFKYKSSRGIVCSLDLRKDPTRWRTLL